MRREVLDSPTIARLEKLALKLQAGDAITFLMDETNFSYLTCSRWYAFILRRKPRPFRKKYTNPSLT